MNTSEIWPMKARAFRFLFTTLLAVFLASLASGRELKQKETGAIQVDYGEYFLFRSEGKTYAILMNVAEDSGDPGVDGAINYSVSRLDETGSFRVIGSARTDERKAGSGWLETKHFKLEWSWNTPKAGWLYIGRLPKGTEYYNLQMKSLGEANRKFDAKHWIAAKIH
jgi:hypothetical protein